MTKQREKVLKTLADYINSVRLHHPVRVAIDGVSASGKTTLANDLATILQDFGKHVIRASIDGFHRPREHRYKRGKDSVEGYYYDSFNHEAIIEKLLAPLGQMGSKVYEHSVFDYKIDLEVKSEPKKASDDSILLFDGVMLMRPELNQYYDIRIFLDVPFDVILERARIRDKEYLGSELEHKYKTRYIPGEKLYLDAVHPEKLADIVIDNSDFNKPTIQFTKKH